MSLANAVEKVEDEVDTEVEVIGIGVTATRGEEGKCLVCEMNFGWIDLHNLAPDMFLISLST